jgi:hypothetical protein
LNRQEFSGETYHFVDKEPVELANLILTIKSYLEVRTPREIYVPYPVATIGKKTMEILLKVFSKIGLKASLPAELMFLESFYKTQTLSSSKLRSSSFQDPMPEETIYTKLPALVIYYLTRWSHQNLISTFSESMIQATAMDTEFQQAPQALLNNIHQDSISPFADLCDVPEP